jgi:hypothetical protein
VLEKVERFPFALFSFSWLLCDFAPLLFVLVFENRDILPRPDSIAQGEEKTLLA